MRGGNGQDVYKRQLLAFAIIFAVVKFMDNPTDPTSLLEIGSRIVPVSYTHLNVLLFLKLVVSFTQDKGFQLVYYH